MFLILPASSGLFSCSLWTSVQPDLLSPYTYCSWSHRCCTWLAGFVAPFVWTLTLPWTVLRKMIYKGLVSDKTHLPGHPAAVESAISHYSDWNLALLVFTIDLSPILIKFKKKKKKKHFSCRLCIHCSYCLTSTEPLAPGASLSSEMHNSGCVLLNIYIKTFCTVLWQPNVHGMNWLNCEERPSNFQASLVFWKSSPMFSQN